MLKSALPRYEALLAQVQSQLGPCRRPLLVGIDGPNGVGKSSLASWLSWQLEMPALHLDLYLVRDSTPQQWRIEDLERAIQARISSGMPVIIEGVLLLEPLEQLGRSPDFLIYIRGSGENEDDDDDIAALAPSLHKSLRDYKLGREPEKRAQVILAPAN
jgi:uridine kinase